MLVEIRQPSSLGKLMEARSAIIASKALGNRKLGGLRSQLTASTFPYFATCLGARKY